MKFPTFVVDFATFIDDFATLSGDNAARERKNCKPEKIPEPHQCGSGIIVRLSIALKKDGCLAAKIYASSAGAAADSADSGVSSVAGAV